MLGRLAFAVLTTIGTVIVLGVIGVGVCVVAAQVRYAWWRRTRQKAGRDR